MGAWEFGPFDNDDAGDWAGRFDRAPLDERLGVLDAAFAAVAEGGYIEIDDCTPAVAAAAVLAALVDGSYGVDTVYGPQNLAETQAAGLTVPPELRDRALTALERVRGNGDAGSEWAELFAEAGVLDEATGHLDRIVAVLRAG